MEINYVNKGICEGRAWEGKKKCLFVNWQQDGENKYEFFEAVYPMYKLYEKLIKQQNMKTIIVKIESPDHVNPTAKEIENIFNNGLSEGNKITVTELSPPPNPSEGK